ncbi:hypothetical protein M513_12342 [Trichuris suis]|uniref:Uncharacterized protein n=1 Tax=Trichuris suis TaxID=68888 RepID=A0A085LP65_9BILA|nr:hypothetical protein M513_12342 [Trichuris suis]
MMVGSFGSSWKSVVRVEKILEDVDRVRDWDTGEEVLYVIADENVGGDTRCHVRVVEVGVPCEPVTRSKLVMADLTSEALFCSIEDSPCSKDAMMSRTGGARGQGTKFSPLAKTPFS